MTDKEYQKILTDLRTLFATGSDTIDDSKIKEALKLYIDGRLDTMYAIHDKLAVVTRELTKESLTIAMLHGNASEHAVRLRISLDYVMNAIAKVNDDLKNKNRGNNNDIGNEPPRIKV